jgi:type IX secretion system PorP/SprF family membrane protein
MNKFNQILKTFTNYQLSWNSFIFMLFLILPAYSFSQQVPRYSQYIMNEFIINPAVAGVDGLTTFNLTARKEWVGFGDGLPTPETYSITVQTRLLKRRIAVKSSTNGNKLLKSRDGRIGIGGGIFADFNGAMQRKGISVSYAYFIPMRENQLSFGLTTSITQLQLNSKYLNFKNNDSEVMLGLANSAIWIPDFAAGVNFSGRKFHTGFSVVQLLESSIIFGNSTVNLQSANIHFRRNYFISGAYRNQFPSHTEWEYEPSVLIKMNDPVKITSTYSGAMVQADIMLRFIYNQKVWFGAAFRTSHEYVALGGLRYKMLYFTYSFDYGNNGITQYSYGSHEISISAKFGESSRRTLWEDRY